MLVRGVVRLDIHVGWEGCHLVQVYAPAPNSEGGTTGVLRVCVTYVHIL